jgi:hypothetical protein
MAWTVQGSNPSTGKRFLFSITIMSLGGLLPSTELYQGTFPGVKWLGHEVDPSPQSSIEVKNKWLHTASPPIHLHDMHINTLRTDRYFFVYIYHKSLIQSKVTFFFFLKIRHRGPFYVCSTYCVIKCVKTKRVLKGNFASSVFHSCNANDANLRHRSAVC